ncbi:ABC transporter permease [Mycoplasma simbae]|uniref:ABC transporter permease n=1 Tax=Mycoplasma simbae TaxID=36744 RepID=UPI0004951339|nr:ABC transporter permease [Mycoplasma simbae]
MWRLFKEVFKSLSKNKVVVIGLSILVFLTSAIFTLLSSVRNVIVGGYDNYKNVSKLHDISVDLNLPTQGNAFNQGYFINGETLESLSKENKKTYSPIVYYVDESAQSQYGSFAQEYLTSNENVLSLTEAPEYIPFSTIDSNNTDFVNKFFKKSDLIQLYSIARSEQKNSTKNPNVIFDINDVNALSFRVNSDKYYLQAYVKNNGQYVEDSNVLTLANNSQLNTQKPIFLGDILSLKTIDGKLYASQISNLYVNLQTAEITDDYAIGQHWIEEEYGATINPAQIAKALGFVYSDLNANNNLFIYEQDTNRKDLSTIIEGDWQNLSETSQFKNSFLLSEFVDQDLSVQQGVYLDLVKNKTYSLNPEWINNVVTKTEFLRNNYYTSYVDKDNSKNKWTGAFKTYIDSLGQIRVANRNSQWDSLETFSTWKKQKVSTKSKFKFDADGNKWIIDSNTQKTTTSVLPLSSSFDYADIKSVKLWTNDTRLNPIDQPYELLKKDSKTIEDIELLSMYDSAQNNFRQLSYAQKNDILSNENLLTEKYTIINSKAYEATKDLIISKIIEKVGPENVGIRQSVTVSAVDDENGVKNSFHFINAGDQNYTISGIKLNIGQLYNEQQSPTALTQLSSSSANNYNTTQLSPYVSSLLLQSIFKNLYSDPNYILPMYDFASVTDFNIETGEARVEYNKKVVRLADYKNDGQDHNNQTTLFGIVGVNSKYKLVRFDETTRSYNVVYPQNMPQEGMDAGLLAQFLNLHNLTIATKFIKTDGTGWVVIDKDYPNVSYIPTFYLAPRSDLMQDVLKNGRIDILTSTIEKFLLNTDLVKKNFISSENVLELSNTLKKVLNNHNFASVFANGKINKGIITEVIFDLVYELSHHPKGDLAKEIIFNIIQQAISQISTSSDLETQKHKLIFEVDAIFKNVQALTQINLSKYITPEGLVNASRDPKIVVQAIQSLLGSFDLRKFSEQSREWFKTQNNKVVYNQDNQPYVTKLSTGNIIKWLFSSIDSKTFKQSLALLIENLDIPKIINLDDDKSILYHLLNNLAPDLIAPLRPIIAKMDAKIEGKQPYSNFKDGLINIIKNVDFNILVNELNKVSKKQFIDYQQKEVDANNKTITKTYKIILDTISPRDGLISFVKSMFSLSGSNRTFKENIIKMFNLSAKTSQIQIEGSDDIVYIPAEDDEKVSFFDFLGIFGSLLQGKDSSIFKNYVYEQQINELIQNISKQTTETVDFGLLSPESIKFIGKFTLFNQKTNRLEVINKLNLLNKFIRQTKGGTNSFLDEVDKTGTDLLADLAKFEDGNTSWLIIKKVIESAAGLEINNEYALAPQAFDIYKPYIQMFLNTKANQEQANKFVQDFLALSVKPSILQLTQKKSTGDNIPFEQNLNYYITEFLQNPETVTLFATQNKQFKNADIESFAKANEQYRDFIIEHKNTLIQQLALIGASAKFSSNTTTHKNGIYHHTINKFVQNYLSSADFYQVRENVWNMINEINPSFSVQAFGISNILINPILRSIFPEIPLTFLASQKSQPGLINGNLAYLVLNKLGDFEALAQSNSEANLLLSSSLDSVFADENSAYKPLNLDSSSNLSIDSPFIDFIAQKAKTLPTVFGINLIQMVPDLLGNIVEPRALNEIIFNSSSSYVAKANFAYLVNNNKEIFNGSIPTDPLEIGDFVNNLDQKYLLDINGVKFIIVGQETTVDYMYPVLDENNLQVNTQNQALVYVNQEGFARIKLAYGGNVIKQALLVKNNDAQDLATLKKDITKIVDQSISDSNKLQRVFYANELDPINPERALRLNTVESIIKLISVATLTLLVAFTVVVSVSIIFIIKRYIANKNKVLGILLAQGYSANRIALSLTVFALVTSVIGGVLGYTVGNRLQLLLLNVFSSYWTLPKETLSFDWASMIFTVFIPFIGMSLLIYIVALISLRFKPTDLMSGTLALPKSKLVQNYGKLFKKATVKRRFSLMLLMSNFWKLVAFSTSALLTSTATIFGMATNNIFNETISNTYKNRHYTFRVDMETPSLEGGPYKLYTPDELQKSLYTPIGISVEAQRETNDYFRPGYSSVINAHGHNGIKNHADSFYDSHVVTQFSASIKVDAGVSADPWLVAYNSMPDSQKAKIDKARDKVGILLEKSQADSTRFFVADKTTKHLKFIDQNNKELNFFKYYKSPFEKLGRFVLAWWNGEEYEQKPITTDPFIREEYRNFLVKGYAKLQARIREERQNPALIVKAPNGVEPDYANFDYWLQDAGPIYGPTLNDYFISFGGVYYNADYDEVYTYILSNYNNKDIKIYGYRQDTKLVDLTDANNADLYEKLNNFNKESVYPLIINEVVSRQNGLYVGDTIELDINNHIKRFYDKIKVAIDPTQSQQRKAKFEIIGINQTFINSEYITTYEAANELVGFNELNLPDNFVKFNGVLTNNANPIQVTGSTGLYAPSGYWSGLDSFNLSSASIESLQAMFDQIFNPQTGVLARTISANEIMKFIDPSSSTFDQSKYDSIREQPQEALAKFASIYNNKIYIALSTSIDSRDIESGFAAQIGNTIQTITVAVIALSFAISLIILVIMSTIMIGENQKNIAIWSIQGYKQREKINMYFSVYIPFILLAILISIPIAALVMYGFSASLLAFTNVSLMLTLSPTYVFLTTAIMFGIFIVTSFITWLTVNQMKPVDLLKGK